MPSTFSAETTLFGIGIHFRSNHPEALRRALAAFPREDHAGSASGRPVHIVLVADEGVVPVAESSRVTGRCLEVRERGIMVTADGGRGRGSCIFQPQIVSSEAFANAINTVVLFLVAQAGRIPVHASAVIVDDRALVFAGRSGMGKSTLAMAADRAGLSVLSEDTVFVQLRPSFCLWGRAEFVHLSEKDAPPAAPGGIRVRSGRLKKAIPIMRRCRKADRAMLFLLTHGDRVIFHKLDPEEAIRALSCNPEPGYEFYDAQLEEAICALAAEGCWSLSLSTTPDEAIAALMGAFSGPAPPAQVRR
ncbi:MAG TPA: hypothetical protein VKR31_06430 [Rhizomicrobium sp.]|nr:hypothetical protein [Rhizomicrobium sp.]